MMDSVPTVFITGQVRTDLIGTDGFQEADVTGITMPVVKHSLLVTDPRHIPEYIHAAFHIASTGRPGPGARRHPAGPLAGGHRLRARRGRCPNLPGYKPPTEGNIKQIRIAAKALANARRPVIYGGGGVVNANASAEFREFCASDRFPVTLTLMGLGAFPAPHEQWLGMLGHARHPHRQLRDGRGRPDRLRRRALRRPDHRQALGVRAAGEVRPHRRRPGRDLEERPRPHPDRRRRQGRARRSSPASTAR